MEQALLQTVGEEEALVDPRALFTQTGAENDPIGQADAAYWNVDRPETAAPPADLVVLADEMGATLTPLSSQEARPELRSITTEMRTAFVRQASAYLSDVTRIHETAERARLQAELLSGMLRGVVVQKRGADFHLVGLENPAYTVGKHHERHLREWAAKWLRSKRFLLDAATAEAVAAKLIAVGRASLGLPAPNPEKDTKPVTRKTRDRMAVPEDAPAPTVTRQRQPSQPRGVSPQQLPLFPTTDPAQLGFGD